MNRSLTFGLIAAIACSTGNIYARKYEDSPSALLWTLSKHLT